MVEFLFLFPEQGFQINPKLFLNFFAEKIGRRILLFKISIKLLVIAADLSVFIDNDQGNRQLIHPLLV